jgi:hypothetical protein
MADDPTTYNTRLREFKLVIRWGYKDDLVDDIAYLDKLSPAKAPPGQREGQIQVSGA